MLSLLAALLLTASPPPQPELRLAAPALSYANLDEKTGEFFLDALAQQLIKQGAEVTTQKEISAVLGLERQKQLIGCGDDQSSCLAELAGALGVDGIVTGSIARTSGGFAANVKVVASSSGKTLAAESGRAKTDDGLLDWFDAAAVKLVAQTRTSLGRDKVALQGPPQQPDGPRPEKVPERTDPQPEEGSPPPSGQLEVLWAGRWFPATALEARPDGKVRIHYEGYSDTWDEWVSRARLRGGPIPQTPPEPPRPKFEGWKVGQALEVQWGSSWYKAKVLEVRKDGHAYISYDGYAESWNEWVPPERTRPVGSVDE